MSPAEILIVDDDPRVINALAKQLGERGYTIRTLTSAFGLLALLREGKAPDVILLDIHMPGLTGDSLLQKIRSSPDFEHVKTPFIFVSGLSPERLEAVGKRAGANGWLSKPVDLDMLCEKIASLIADPTADVGGPHAALPTG